MRAVAERNPNATPIQIRSLRAMEEPREPQQHRNGIRHQTSAEYLLNVGRFDWEHEIRGWLPYRYCRLPLVLRRKERCEAKYVHHCPSAGRLVDR